MCAPTPQHARGTHKIPSLKLISEAIVATGSSFAIGGDAAVTIARPAHSSGSGTDTMLVGQAAAGGDGNGGALILEAGAKHGSGTDGTVFIKSGATTQLTVSPTSIVMHQDVEVAAVLHVREIRFANSQTLFTDCYGLDPHCRYEVHHMGLVAGAEM